MSVLQLKSKFHISETKISKMDALVENQRLSTLVKHHKIQTKCFDDLPEEVLLKICAYLSLQSLIRCSRLIPSSSSSGRSSMSPTSSLWKEFRSRLNLFKAGYVLTNWWVTLADKHSTFPQRATNSV